MPNIGYFYLWLACIIVSGHSQKVISLLHLQVSDLMHSWYLSSRWHFNLSSTAFLGYSTGQNISQMLRFIVTPKNPITCCTVWFWSHSLSTSSKPFPVNLLYVVWWVQLAKYWIDSRNYQESKTREIQSSENCKEIFGLLVQCCYSGTYTESLPGLENAVWNQMPDWFPVLILEGGMYIKPFPTEFYLA